MAPHICRTALVLLISPAAARYEPIGFPSCVAGEYFDVSALSCFECPAGQEPDESGKSCRCVSGFLSGTTCAPCSLIYNNSAPTRDGAACVPCIHPNATCAHGDLSCALSPGNDGECRCEAGHGLVIVERYGNGALLPVKRCEPCPLGSYPVDGACVACPTDHMQASADFSRCECVSGYQAIQHANGFWGRSESCVSTSAYNELEGFYPATASRLTYYALPASQGSQLVIESKVVLQLLMPSATECLQAVQASDDEPRALSLLDGNEACQAVGNLCVLFDYEESSPACQLYRFLQSEASGSVNPGNLEWKSRLPGLYYPDRGVVPLTQAAPPVEAVLALPPAAGSRMRYVLAGYSLNGTYQGLVELSDQLQLCAGGGASATSYLDFGTDFALTCDVPLLSLLATTDVIYYDLYLYYDGVQSTTPLDQITSGALYPVPVLLKNLRNGGAAFNANPETFDDQLTRRFFTVDALSGVSQAGQLPAVVRYLKTARLTATIRSDDAIPSQILPPLLEIEYAEVALAVDGTALDAQAALLSSGVEITTSFLVRHTMQMDNSNAAINNFFVIALVVWVLGTIAAGIIMVRRSRGAFEGYHRLVAQACNVFATVFFALLYGVATWWLCMYKGQSTLYFFMPVETVEDRAGQTRVHMYLGLMPFDVFIGVMFGAKFLHMLDILYVQTHHDLFFIDWEQPRTVATGAEDERDVESTSGRTKKGEVPVSVWRTIFVANEWVKLQEARTVSTELSLIFVLFLLEGLGVDRSAALQPHGEAGLEVPYHRVLRFALSSGLLLGASLVQWIFKWAVWERFVPGQDRVWQFVDLLAVTNISCLLLEEQYYGFYLHGRSVHDHADNDMAQLNAYLKLEAEGFAPTRGFTPDSRVQTYEVHLARKVREKYDAAFLGVLEGAQRSRGQQRGGGGGRAGGGGGGGGGASSRTKGFRASPEEGIHRQRELNQYLMTYLGTPQPSVTGASGTSGAAAGERPVVRRMGMWERYGVPPDMGYGDRSIFLEDSGGRFKRLLLAGREFDVILLNVLTYALFDMTTANSFVAVFATYALDLLLRRARSFFAAQNIAFKTLLDDRFLL